MVPALIVLSLYHFLCTHAYFLGLEKKIGRYYLFNAEYENTVFPLESDSCGHCCTSGSGIKPGFKDVGVVRTHAVCSLRGVVPKEWSSARVGESKTLFRICGRNAAGFGNFRNLTNVLSTNTL